MRSIRNTVVLNFSAQLPKSQAIFSITCRKNETIARFVLKRVAVHGSLIIGGTCVSINDAVKDVDRH
jgi:hypothetical protein